MKIFVGEMQKFFDKPLKKVRSKISAKIWPPVSEVLDPLVSQRVIFHFHFHLLLLIKNYTYSIIVVTHIKQALLLSIKAYQQCHTRVMVKHSGKND